MIEHNKIPAPRQPAPGRSGSEKCFEITLPALVKGIDAEGHSFEEKTEIARISSEEAVFRLKQRVLIDTPLHLTLCVPRTLILGSDLNLKLSGSVLCARMSRTDGEQIVALRLRPTYSIQTLRG